MSRNPLEPGELRGLRAPWALRGVRLWTGSRCLAGAVAFGRHGRIVGCGSAADVLARLPAGTEVVDGRGAFVAPGFVDPHLHVRAGASARLAVDVSRARDRGELLSAVRGACAAGDAWATLVGLTAGSPASGGAPGRRELDAVSGGVRVRIRDRTGHGWLFNSAGLAALGLDAESSAPPGVVVEQGPDRAPTGFVVDHVGWVGQRLGRVTDDRRLERAVRAWSHELARAGVVAACDVTATNGLAEIRSLRRWRRAGALRQEITFLTAPGAVVDDAARPQRAGLKFVDAHDPRLPAALQGGHGEGIVAVHCVDTAQTGAVLQAATRAGTAAVRGRLRLEHASFIAPDWIAPLAALGATVVTHPSFVDAFGDRYLADPELTPHDWLYRLASWRDGGVALAFASDAPYGPFDPLRALRAAASRRTARGRSLGPAEALSGDAALRALTTTAAACSRLARFGYGRLGADGPGAAVVLTGDPRDLRALGDVRVAATVIGGDVVD
jgi:predicted amidohydrolase YtcJ